MYYIFFLGIFYPSSLATSPGHIRLFSSYLPLNAFRSSCAIHILALCGAGSAPVCVSTRKAPCAFFHLHPTTGMLKPGGQGHAREHHTRLIRVERPLRSIDSRKARRSKPKTIRYCLTTYFPTHPCLPNIELLSCKVRQNKLALLCAGAACTQLCAGR